ncbi:MAG: MMPL family transporter [Deltaproteobacteria bacterium]|nr:MAG: MMPL family transporter [Deltaproteobacteria bacterium]
MNENSTHHTLGLLTTRYRWLTILLTLLITGYFVIEAVNLRVDNSYEVWLPKQEKVTKLYKKIGELFSANMAFVILDLQEVFTTASLQQIKHITELLEEMPELANVMSLTNAIDIREIEGDIDVSYLVENIPQHPEDLTDLKSYVMSREMYINTFVSADSRYTAIIANIRGDADDVKVSKKVRDYLQESIGPEGLYFGGDPIYTVYIDEYTEKDLRTLTLVVVALVGIILFLGLRRITGVLLPLSMAALAIIYVLGMQALFDMPRNVMTVSVIVLIFAVGSDYAVHVLNHFQRRRTVEAVISQLSSPIVMSAVTTIAGLLTFTTTRIPILQTFGLELAIGLGSAMFLSLTFLPALLTLVGKFVHRKPRTARSFDPFNIGLTNISRLVTAHPRLLIFSFLILMILMTPGFFRIAASYSIIGILPEGSIPREAARILRQHFGGSYIQCIHFHGDHQQPAVLKTHMKVGNYLRSRPEFEGRSSLADLIAELNRLINGTYSIPETTSGVGNLWFFLEGEKSLENFVTSDREHGLVIAYTPVEVSTELGELTVITDRFLSTDTDNRLLGIDTTSLSPKDRERLNRIKVHEAAKQIHWLARAYGGDIAPSIETIEKELLPAFEESLEWLEVDPILLALEQYLGSDQIPVEFPAEWREELLEKIGSFLTTPIPDEKLPAQIHQQLLEFGDVFADNEEEAAYLSEDIGQKVEVLIKENRFRYLTSKVGHTFPEELRDHKFFRKRSEGVIWELYDRVQWCFPYEIAESPSLQQAAVETVPVEITQVGMPTFFEMFDRLLYRSQIQSLILAALIVFILLLLSQRSLRSALFSILSVLIPLYITLGAMGYLDIPLDFGTVLTGGLIIGLGVDATIHIMHFLRRLLKEGSPPRQAIIATIEHVGKAVLTANLTTAIGLGSIVLSNLEVMRKFGLINALAIILVTVSCLVLLPSFTLLGFREKGNRS